MTINHYFLAYLPKHHTEQSVTILRRDGLCGTAKHQTGNGSIAIPLKAIDLQARYGDPDVQRFIVRPTVRVTAEYGPERKVCGMLVGPEMSLLRDIEPAKYLRPELMTEILDEAIPESDRGTETSHIVSKSGCNELETADYLGVAITRFRHNCRLPNPETEETARIVFRDVACVALK